MSLTTKLSVYVSPYPDPLAWDVDALSLSGEGIWGYAFLPTPNSSPGSEQGSERELFNFVDSPSISRGVLVQLVIATGGRRTQGASSSQKSPVSAPGRDFRRGLPLVSLGRSESPLGRSMMQNGRFSWLGVVNSRSIHSIPLFHS